MKKIILIFLITYTNLSMSQNYTRDDIFKVKKVYFYGYDFTNFKFVEAKRVGQDVQIKGVLFEIIQWMNTKKPEVKYQNLIDKDTVIFDETTVNDLNMKIKAENLIDPFVKHSIPKDSLQVMVNRYNTIGKSGIGLVQIIECFYKPKKEATIWYVFFDIASKKILDSTERTNVDADSYHGIAEYWCVGLCCEMGEYHANYYKKELKAYKKRLGK